MKNKVYLMIALMLSSFLLVTTLQASTLSEMTNQTYVSSFTSDQVSVGLETEGDNLPIMAIVVAGVYEILSRIIPTVKDYTIVGRFIKWIHKLSDALNVKRT